MRRREHIMPCSINILCLAYGKTAPQKKHYPATLLRQRLYGGIGKEFPAMALVRTSLMRPHRQRGVQKQYPLIRPTRQVATGQRYLRPQVAVYLFDDIHQRRRNHHPCRHRETESMCLAGLVVWVLTQYHHLHLVERRAVECGKDVAPFRVAHILLPFGHQKFFQLGKVGSLKLRPQHLKPRGFYLGIYHIRKPLYRCSSPIVLSSPCPGSTSYSSGSVIMRVFSLSINTP